MITNRLHSFILADIIRREHRAITRLQMGIKVAMLTGDSQEVAKSVASELGIDTFYAEVVPENKDRHISDLQKQGKRVAMVGDGVNDAPALTRANVGIAIGSGTDVAVESAGIILVKSNPMDVVKIFELSRASYRKMVENLAWAPDLASYCLAAGIWHRQITLHPQWGIADVSQHGDSSHHAQLLRRTDWPDDGEYS
jgi:Cu2+-exporting ATPase